MSKLPLVQDSPDIPDKLYFRIGEVAELCQLPTYVLRFWETEFPQLKPTKSSTGQRMYRRKDVELLLEIKHLLYEKRFTIEGARKWLQARQKGAESAAAAAAKRAVTQTEMFPSAAGPQNLTEIRRELRSILDLLK